MVLVLAHMFIWDEFLKGLFIEKKKLSIYQILGMWESLRKKQADEAALNKALSAISSSIK